MAMEPGSPDLKQPIRVVVFGGGPGLERGLELFLFRLEGHPEIELAGCFCQSAGRSLGAVLADLWKRRKLLALPVLLLQAWRTATRSLSRPGFEIEIRRMLTRITRKIHFVRDIHAASVLETVRSLEPDLGLVYGGPRLRPELFLIPKFGTLGIHHGKLPEYRGKKTTFWAMFNAAETAGVTIQRINAGLDTGDIVRQGEVPIGRRSFQAVWNDVESLGFDLYLQAILDVKCGSASYHRPAGSPGHLYRDPRLSDIVIFVLRRFVHVPPS